MKIIENFFPDFTIHLAGFEMYNVSEVFSATSMGRFIRSPKRYFFLFFPSVHRGENLFYPAFGIKMQALEIILLR